MAQMTKEIPHRKCKYFGYAKCPHINDEIMKLATQDIPEAPHGVPTLLTFPNIDEVDKICTGCDLFTLK